MKGRRGRKGERGCSRSAAKIGAIAIAVGSMACRVENPGFGELARAPIEECGDDASCEAVPGHATGATGHVTGTSGFTSGDTVAAASTQDSTRQVASYSSGEESSGSGDFTGTQSGDSDFDPDEGYQLGCEDGAINCYTMHYDPYSRSFANRSPNGAELRPVASTKGLQLRTTGDTGAFRHILVFDGTGYGLKTQDFTLPSTKEVGLELKIRNLRCASNQDCYFANVQGVLAIGFSPATSELKCVSSNGAVSKKRLTADQDETVHVGCWVSGTELRVAVDSSRGATAQAEKMVSRTVSVTLGPSVDTSKSATGGAMLDVGWLRVWENVDELKERFDKD